MNGKPRFCYISFSAPILLLQLICLGGVKLFPFQHMAIKAMLESDYFMGVWSRGMSKTFTTSIFAFLDAILNQGVEIGVISKSFRQAKMIFKKIEDILAKPEAAMLAQCVTRKAKNNDIVDFGARCKSHPRSPAG